MKKIILSVFLLSATVFTVAAQSSPLQFGIKAGVNFATLKDINTEASSRTGYIGGVWARIGGAGLHVQPELYLTSKGSELKNEEGSVDFTTLELPILLGTKIGLGPIGARLQAGPVVSFVMSEKDNFKEDIGQVLKFKEYKNQTIGLTGGVGIDVSNLSLDVRYQQGLTEVLKGTDNNGKMSLWTVALGFRIF